MRRWKWKRYSLYIENAKGTMFLWNLFLPPPTTFSAIPRQNKMVLKFYPRNILAKHVWPPSPPHTTPLGRGTREWGGEGWLHQWKCFPARKKGFGLHWWVGSMILYGICLNQTKGRILKPKSSKSSTNGQLFQKVENDENRFFAITSSKLVRNWFCKKYLLRNNIFHNYCFLYVL